MSLFKSLGDAIGIPKISSEAEASSFSLATITQKAAEMGGKIFDSGMNSLFSKGVVNSSNLSNATQSALNSLFAPTTSAGVPANLMPNSGSLGDTAELKVIIRQDPAVGSMNEVVFNVMPRIDESASVDYEAISPIHHPGVIQKYRNSSVRSWRISARLISRTSEEATTNLEIINTIRSWQKPFYGEGTAQSMPDKLGAPPPILTLSAYGPRMIGPAKCVMKDCNWSWDNTLDWIPTIDGNPFPVILDVNLSLEESWSPAEYSGFDIVKYKQGDLGNDGAFQKVTAVIPPPSSTTTAATTVTSTVKTAGAGRGIFGGPTAEALTQYDQAQFQAKAAAANMTSAVTGGGAALIFRKPTRSSGGASGSF